MFHLFSIAAVGLVAASTVAGVVIPRRDPPQGWNFAILEPYQTYHTRYLALDCQDKHSQAFFDQCCHPLLASQNLTDRPAQCIPSVSKSSSAAPASSTHPATSTASSHSATSTVVAAPTKPAATSSAAPAPHTTAKPTTTSKSAAPKATTTAAAGGSGSGQTFTGGVATFFFQGGVAGACGTVHKDTDFVAAIDQTRYGNSGDKSALCGRQVAITNKKNGNSVTVTIADDCPTCINENSIDLSESAFKQIATEEEGEVPIEWHFL
ncbi:hypothetical protein FA95DRAFT_1530154 [Auriscalpium vulgare]|uniref:Uncharacterized protein n=1 Tax=Auriscalpium vulgare TaxID=40419 RepID=A0ACB8SEG1_9AGAM|nr:hypothetical protein FA95DRAFT_1530154 [Auriscalpium vulgare]